MTKQLGAIFLISFGLNYVWEHLHSLLYVHYKGGPITEFILLRATLADAVIITLIALPFIASSRIRPWAWLMIPLGIAVSIIIEMHALPAGRWAYSAMMPLVPLVGTGWTPTIQLGLLGYLSYRMTERMKS